MGAQAYLSANVPNEITVRWRELLEHLTPSQILLKWRPGNTKIENARDILGI